MADRRLLRGGERLEKWRERERRARRRNVTRALAVCRVYRSDTLIVGTSVLWHVYIIPLMRKKSVLKSIQFCFEVIRVSVECLLSIMIVDSRLSLRN